MKRTRIITLHTLFGLLASIASYGLFLSLTNPDKLPIIFLAFPSILLSSVIYFGVRLIQQTPLLESRRLTAFAAALYCLLLSLLASLQQLGWRDIILAAILVWLLTFYFNRYRT